MGGCKTVERTVIVQESRAPRDLRFRWNKRINIWIVAVLNTSFELEVTTLADVWCGSVVKRFYVRKCKRPFKIETINLVSPKKVWYSEKMQWHQKLCLHCFRNTTMPKPEAIITHVLKTLYFLSHYLDWERVTFD